jgi:hypothetical protein
MDRDLQLEEAEEEFSTSDREELIKIIIDRISLPSDAIHPKSPESFPMDGRYMCLPIYGESKDRFQEDFVPIIGIQAFWVMAPTRTRVCPHIPPCEDESLDEDELLAKVSFPLFSPARLSSGTRLAGKSLELHLSYHTMYIPPRLSDFDVLISSENIDRTFSVFFSGDAPELAYITLAKALSSDLDHCSQWNLETTPEPNPYSFIGSIRVAPIVSLETQEQRFSLRMGEAKDTKSPSGETKSTSGDRDDILRSLVSDSLSYPYTPREDHMDADDMPRRKTLFEEWRPKICPSLFIAWGKVVSDSTLRRLIYDSVKVREITASRARLVEDQGKAISFLSAEIPFEEYFDPECLLRCEGMVNPKVAATLGRGVTVRSNNNWYSRRVGIDIDGVRRQFFASQEDFLWSNVPVRVHYCLDTDSFLGEGQYLEIDLPAFFPIISSEANMMRIFPLSPEELASSKLIPQHYFSKAPPLTCDEINEMERKGEMIFGLSHSSSTREEETPRLFAMFSHRFVL